MLSHVQLFAALWIVAHQVPLSIGFFRQECWSGLSLPAPGDLPHLRIEHESLVFPALAGRFIPKSTTWDAHKREKEKDFFKELIV